MDLSPNGPCHPYSIFGGGSRWVQGKVACFVEHDLLQKFRCLCVNNNSTMVQLSPSECRVPFLQGCGHCMNALVILYSHVDLLRMAASKKTGTCTYSLGCGGIQNENLLSACNQSSYYLMHEKTMVYSC